MTYGRMDIYRPEATGALVFNRDETATLVSVFEKAINIRLSDGCLISVIRHADAMTPMSIYCPSLLVEKAARCRVGQGVIIKDDTLTADGWCLDVNSSKRFEGFAVIERPFSVNAHRVALFEKILHFSGQSGGLLGITGKAEPQNAFARKGQEIVKTLLSDGWAHLTANLAKFVGLGPGFTPSGDDLICGFLIGEAFSQCPMLAPQDRVTLWQTTEGTSDAGRTLIWMALMGRFPQFLCRAAKKLACAETGDDLLAMVTAASYFGHTSGTDALTGLLLHLKLNHQYVVNDRCPDNAPISGNQDLVSISR